MVLLFHEQEPYDLSYIKIIHFYTYFTLKFKSICSFVWIFCSSAKHDVRLDGLKLHQPLRVPQLWVGFSLGASRSSHLLVGVWALLKLRLRSSSTMAVTHGCHCQPVACLLLTRGHQWTCIWSCHSPFPCVANPSYKARHIKQSAAQMGPRSAVEHPAETASCWEAACMTLHSTHPFLAGWGQRCSHKDAALSLLGGWCQAAGILLL